MFNKIVLMWVSDCSLSQVNIVQLYHCENKLSLGELMTMCAVYQTNMFSLNFIMLTHKNNSPRVDMPIHSDALSWFRVNSFPLISQWSVLSGEAVNGKFIVFGLTGQEMIKCTIYHSSGYLKILLQMTYKLNILINELPRLRSCVVW